MRLVPLLLAVAACGGSTPKSAVHNAPARLKSRVAIAVVMQGTEVWVGNETEVPEVRENSPDRYVGVLIPLRQAIARLELTKRADVDGALITYNDKVDVRVPLGPIAKLDEKAFGIQRDYYGAVGSELAAGVRAGLTELAHADAPSKILVVIGDGADSEPDIAEAQLAELGKQAKTEGVTVHAIVYRSRLSPERKVIGLLTSNIHKVTTAENIAVTFESVMPQDEPAPGPVAPGLGVAFVVQGWEAWIGNETEVPEITPSSIDRFEGVLVPLRKAIDAAQFSGFPAEARGIVITYADNATIRAPMGPLRKVTGRAFGTQQDYFGTTGSELVSGVRAAMTELRKANMTRRVLIVLGDGRDTDMDAAKAQLAALKKQAEQEHIEIHAVVFRSKLSGEGTVVQHLTDRVVPVARRDDLPAAMKPLLDGLRK